MKNHLKSLVNLTISLSLMSSACGQDVPQIDRDCTKMFPKSDTLISTHGDWARIHYPNRLEEFKQDIIQSGDIVMLGNSLTEQGDDWSSKLGVSNVINRGISGDNTDGVLARLEEIICGSPSKIFLMIGTNDLWTNYSSKEVSANIDLIGQKLVDELPNAEVFVQTVMPLAAGNEKLDKLSEINTLLRALDQNHYTLINTHMKMANDQGYLPSELTTDGVHLNAAGYEKWSTILKPYINQ